MKHLKSWLKKPLKTVPNSLVIFLLIVALLGFVDATYLTIEHFKGVIPPCTAGFDCTTVLTSEYSKVLGIPVSLLGSIFYLMILMGIFSYLNNKNLVILKWALGFTTFGFISSLWFLYVQAFVLKSFCVYCVGSMITSTLLFVVSIYIQNKYSLHTEGVSTVDEIYPPTSA